MKTQLPKTLYVRREADGKESCLVAGETVREHCVINETRIVGEYKLGQRMEVEAQVVTIADTKF